MKKLLLSICLLVALLVLTFLHPGAHHRRENIPSNTVKMDTMVASPHQYSLQVVTE